MKRFKKYLYWILVTVVLSAVVLYGFLKSSQEAIGFRVDSPSGAEVISVYDADGCGYVFLPSYARLDRVTVVLPGSSHITLDGMKLSNGMDCGAVQPGKVYTMVYNGLSRKVKFLISANVAAMYVNTESGSMDQIHQDKNNKEAASVAVYTTDGQQNYSNSLCTIQGRGNTSWRPDKKPYTLTLESPAQLLNMGISGKWVLLANAYDPSHIKNKLVYDFAREIGTYEGWSPECSYVELYLNGEYAGLYLLCKKIDAGPDFLNLEPEDALLEMTLEKRLDESNAAICIGSGQAIEIVHPADCADGQKAELEMLLREFQSALFSGPEVRNVPFRNWDTYIDMDSWARKYLIEEIFSNFDAGKASQYFWWDASEEKLIAGPCWDYDRTLGKMVGTSWYTPCCLLAQRTWTESHSWYSALWQKEEFRQRVIALYRQEFRPLLQTLLQTGIDQLAAQMETAAQRDGIRWPEELRNTSQRDQIQQVTEYLREHTAFLDKIWLEGQRYCSVTMQTTETYSLYVPWGTACESLPQPGAFGLEGQWYLQGTDSLFDAAAPITEDIILECKATDAGGFTVQKLSAKGCITLVSVGVLMCLFLWAAIADIRARKMERRNQDEQSAAQLSP